MAGFTVTLASVTNYDLTDTAVNPQAYPQSTPRQGGFTIQNRIDFDTVTAPTATKTVANMLKLVKIPPRCMVNRVIFAVPPGATDVTHKYTDASGSALSGASAGKSVTINVGYGWFKSKAAYDASTYTAANLIQDVDAVCDLVLTKKTGVVATATELPQTDASHPEYGAINVYDTSATPPDMFPYGGWLTLQLAAGASASSVYGQLCGDLHVILECAYMPE